VIKPEMMRWVGYVACMGGMKNAYSILVGKHGGKRLLGRPSCRWEDNFRMDLRVMGWEGVDWIYVASNRDQWLALVNTIINLQVP